MTAQMCGKRGRAAGYMQVAQGDPVVSAHPPVRAPRADAITLRFVGTIRREPLDGILIIN